MILLKEILSFVLIVKKYNIYQRYEYFGKRKDLSTCFNEFKNFNLEI